MAAALAIVAARLDKRTLICEVDAKGDLAAGLECGPLAFEPTLVEDRLSAMTMETEASLREYLALNLRLPVLTKIGPVARTFDFVASAAPGVREILTVGKLCYEVRERHYDLVVVDGPATGHVVGQLSAAEGIRDLVQVGLVRGQTQWMLDLLNDPAVAGVVAVTLAEEMPVTETIELIGRLDGETGVDLASVVVNRVLPELFGRPEEEVFDRLAEPVRTAWLSEAIDGPADELLDAASFAVRLRRSRAVHMARLRDELSSRCPLVYVPELFGRRQGRRSVDRVADALEAELA